MSGPTTSDPFWNSEKKRNYASSIVSKRKKRAEGLTDPLDSIDEAPDFHDPYSDLSLFLSQKIKERLLSHGTTRRWSLRIQEELISQIGPEFQKRFPQYRLGISALKKTWEKVQFFAELIQNKKEAISQDGRLNVHYFIRENLKDLASSSYHTAQQMAIRLSECIATVDGIRPRLDHLTRMIWSIQRHLIRGMSPEELKSPYDEYDKVDRLIIKITLETTAKDPTVSMQELQHRVKEGLMSLHELPPISSSDQLTANVAALLAEKLYPASTFHLSVKEAIIKFVRRHGKLCKLGVSQLPMSDLVRRITALYTLATQLPKEIDRDIFSLALSSLYPTVQKERPALSQSFYAFLSAELLLGTTDVEGLWQSYQEAISLPQLNAQEQEALEILIWKHLSELEGTLEKLPYRLGQRIEEEIGSSFVDQPQQRFSSIVYGIVSSFKRAKEATEVKGWSEIEQKIHNWIIQGDMLCRWIRIDPENGLCKLILSLWPTDGGLPTDHLHFTSQVCQSYLAAHPHLTIYAGPLSTRIAILYKHIWLTHPSHEKLSSLDCLVKWHACGYKTLSEEERTKRLSDLFEKMLPLIPSELVVKATLQEPPKGG